MPETDLAEGLARYFTARAERRQQDIADTYLPLERQMTAFLEHFVDDGHLGAYIARMIRETAVAAYVRGTMRANPARVEPPPDEVMLFEALEAVRSNDDLYPAWRVFDGRATEENDDD